jgi:hypothetical protein
MTEYDYSPDAIERQNAKQAQIADWVDRTKQHEPANPFVPIPGEHAPSETYDPYPQPYHPRPQYPQAQYPYQFQHQPQPAFYATHQGVISPTYASSSKQHYHKRHHNSHHHRSGSKSLRPSPQTATAALPMGMGVSYAPTPQRSVSTPPSMTMMTSNGMVVPVAMTSTQSYFGYPAQQQQLYQPLMSPPTMQGQGYPFPYVTSPPAMAPAYSRSSSHSHSHTNSRPSSSRHSSSHSYSQSQHQLNLMPQSPPLQSPPYSAPYGQVYHSPSNQPVVVPINGGSGGYVVVPAGQSVHVLR